MTKAGGRLPLVRRCGTAVFPIAGFVLSSLALTCLAFSAAADSTLGAEASPPPPPRTDQHSVEFTRDVIPALTKAGCNQGKCHGSFQGRGGFRLSLLGFDPQYDFDALVLESRGRRLLRSAPEQSLLLRKPSGRVPHGGGILLKPDSPAYQTLVSWIEAGLPRPSASDPTVVSLQVEPADLQLTPGESAELRVFARWSDGVRRDVTSWALYESQHESIAEVSRLGLVSAQQPGRTAVTIQYMGQVAAVTVTIPVASQPAPFDWRPETQIDRLVAEEWRKMGYQPAPLADDAEFLRRASLDIIGTLPTPDEVLAFVESSDPRKRSKLIETLLDRPEYVDYWSLKWGDLLRVHRRYLGDKGLANYSGWVRRNVRENRPIDQMVRELLTAKGNLYSNGPVGFYLTDSTPENFTETTAQAFLGMRIHCARCHHHPYEVWSQEDYYGLAAFFTRFELKDNRDNGRFGGAKIIRPTAAPNKAMRLAINVPPRVFGRPLTEQELSGDIRQVLADWITDERNPYFASSFANRYWAHFMGRGLVHPVDDFRDTNPPSHPALLEYLTREFVASGFDAKRLIRLICNSRVYQLASEPQPQRDEDGMFYTHRKLQRLPAEVLLDAINQAAETVEPFEGLPPGARAIALPDPSIRSYFLQTFGRSERTSPCECSRTDLPDLAQALHFVNGDPIHQKVTDSKGRIARLIAAERTNAEIIHELFLATYSRPPHPREFETASRLVREATDRREGLEDLLWTLLNSTWFVFNH